MNPEIANPPFPKSRRGRLGMLACLGAFQASLRLSRL